MTAYAKGRCLSKSGAKVLHFFEICKKCHKKMQKSLISDSALAQPIPPKLRSRWRTNTKFAPVKTL